MVGPRVEPVGKTWKTPLSRIPATDTAPEQITRRRWLIEQTFIDCHARGEMPGMPLIREAVDTTLLAHPEWDPDEYRTRDQWAQEDA